MFLFVLSFGLAVQAHSGRTDASGGHNCSQSSINKGLCSGYHNHNGGGSSSESVPAPSASTQPNDKDCTDFVTYDQVVQYWNSKGYSATYDPENLDGWGNGQVDDGIPCEVPGGYDTAKINGSPAQISAKTAVQEKSKGETEGYPAGLEAGYHDLSSSVNQTGSAAYIEGYKAGFNKGWAEGSEKLKVEKETADKAGYEFGKTQDQLTIPKEYEHIDSVKASFEEGFNRAVTERDAVKKKEFLEKGYQEGKNDVHNVPTDIKEVYIKAYEEGYEKGQSELKESYVKQGYEAAFTMLKYSIPKLDNEKYISWYKEGFESNNDIDKIAKEAFNLGIAGSSYKVPTKYKKAEPIFKNHYELGFKEYEMEQAESNQQTTTGIGTILLAWLGRRFYVAKKMVS